MIVTVAQQKGGVGKTTTALNVSAELGRAGRRVLAIDLDPQFALTRQLGVVTSTLRASVVDVLSGRCSARAAVVPRVHGIDLLAAHRELAAVELALVSEFGRERFLSEALEPLVGDYDDVIIDTPPNLGLLTVNGLMPAELVLAPVSAEDEGSAQGLAELRTTVARVERLRDDRALPITAITSKWRSRRVMSDVVERAVADLGVRVGARIEKRAILQQAAVHRMPVGRLAPRNEAAVAYADLTRRLLAEYAR